MELSYTVGNIIEKGLTVSYKTKYIPICVYAPAIPLQNIYQRTEKKHSQERSVYTSIETYSK